MNARKYILIAVALVILAAIITNPREKKHQEKVRAEVVTFAKDIVDEKFGPANLGENSTLITDMLIQQVNDNTVKSRDFLLFSITKISFTDEKYSIGVGLFGHVFLFKKADDILRQQLSAAIQVWN